MTSKAIQKEVDRQIEVMRDGAVDLFGEHFESRGGIHRDYRRHCG